MDDLIGIPFLPKGRDPKTGLDCWGLVVEVFRRSRIALPEHLIDPSEHAAIAAAISKASSSGQWEKIEQPEPFAVVVIRQHPEWEQHLGVCLGSGKFIHSRIHLGVGIDRLEDPVYKHQIKGYYRYVG